MNVSKLLHNIRESNWKLLVFYLLSAVGLRMCSIFPSVMDHDESTYILIAKQIFSGQIYFVDTVDTKPLGIFILFGFLQQIFGSSIVIIRIATSLTIGATAFFLSKGHRYLMKNAAAAFAVGFIYIVMCSIYTDWGISPNTEQFFNCFTALGVLLLFRKNDIRHHFLTGLALGIGFIIKPVVLFDVIAIALFLAWQAMQHKTNFLRLFKRYVVMGIGFTLPFAIIVFNYWSIDRIDEFLFYTFEVSGNYFVSASIIDYVTYLGEFMARFIPVFVFVIVVLMQKSLAQQQLKMLFIFWFISALFIVLYPGKLFSHYLIQLMLPLSFIAGSFFDSRRIKPAIFSRLSRKVYATIFALLFIGITIGAVKSYILKPDYPKQIAQYIEPYLWEEDVLYTSNAEHIIYHLVDKKIPTPYVHPSLIWNSSNVKALGIDQNEELKKIFLQEPKIVLTKQNSCFDNDYFKQQIESKYKKINEIDEVSIFLRND